MLPPEKYGVSYLIGKVPHSPSRSDPRTFQLQKENQASRAPVAIVACETEHNGRHPQEGCRGMCSGPLDPGGEVRGCSVGCTIGMSDIAPFRAARIRTLFTYRAIKPLDTAVRTWCHLINLSVCVTFVSFADYESCTRPISTKPGSIEAGYMG